MSRVQSPAEVYAAQLGLERRVWTGRKRGRQNLLLLESEKFFDGDGKPQRQVYVRKVHRRVTHEDGYVPHPFIRGALFRIRSKGGNVNKAKRTALLRDLRKAGVEDLESKTTKELRQTMRELRRKRNA
jgi:hypothetical protein